jgi:hypothetical protein
MKMKNCLIFISIESIESLESLEPQYRFGLESVDTEKSVSIDSSSHRSEAIIFMATIVGVVIVYYHSQALSYFEESFQERSP